MDSRPVGIFDSGIGGLTVVKEIRNILPREKLIYLGDTARVPYGTRSPGTIKTFAVQLAKILLQKNVKALVIACNTISATSLPEIKKLSPLPVLGVIEPTVSEALRLTQSQSLAVIGTTATINSGIYARTLHKYLPSVRIKAKATPLLVPIIEEGLFSHPVADLMIADYLAEIKNDALDTLILGCTHYPLLREKIAGFLGNKFTIVDSAKPTARALKELLAANNLLSDRSRGTQIFFTSDDPRKSAALAKTFLGGRLAISKLAVN